jgi:hypothetical protein
LTIEEELQAAIIGESILDAPYDGSPVDSDQANRWLAELDNVRTKRAEVEAAFNAAVARMRDVVDRRLANLDQHEEVLLEALEVYHQMKLAEDPDGAKTIVYPCGTLVSRMGQPSYDVDTDIFDAWALQNLPGAVEHPEPKVSWSAAKKLLKDARVSDGRICLTDGTVVPGVVVHDAERTFKAKTE